MQKDNVQILSTRPLDEQLIKNAASKNIIIDVKSFIETEAIDSLEVHEEIKNTLLQSSNVVFTSMNAVEAVAVHLDEYKPDWKVYCIGNTTKKLVEEYFGEELVASTANDATALANEIVEDEITGEVIFFCGNKRRDELPGILNQHGIDVYEIEVYRSGIVKHRIKKKYDGILFFSPSAVESFFSNNKPGEETVLFAIGNTTAAAIKNYSQNKIVIADAPGKSNLIKKAIAYFL